MTSACLVVYDLSFESRAQHLVDVTATYPQEAVRHTPEGYVLDLLMPVWTPGSYMVREFARQVQDVRASDATGAPLPTTKISKNGWRIRLAQASAVTLRYRVFGREMTVRSNCIEADFALVQGAATYLSPRGAGALPHHVRVHLPQGFDELVCGLEVQAADGVLTAIAADFDTLVDSPLALGCPRLQHFDVAGKRHTLGTFGGAGLFDDGRAAMDFERIVARTAELFGVVPYDRYVMINLLYGGQGGLEHRHSAVIMASPWAMRSEATYRSFLGLMAHEHFHAWNIKRLRPKALGPFDYDQENYTPSLWIAEGLTAFYDNLMVVRAGLCDPAAYLTELASEVTTLHNTAGRHKQSLSEASFDAWIKFYRRDENTDNTAVSYYLKGALVGMLLNAELIGLSEGAVCLDDVMRLAYSRYSGAQGFEEAQFRALVREICPQVPEDFLQRAVDTTEELSFDRWCEVFGIDKSAIRKEREKGKGVAAVELGLALKDDPARLVVAQVSADMAAWSAGLQADDEILAIDGYRMTPTTWGHWLQMAVPHRKVQVLLSRYDRVRTLELVPAPPGPKVTRLTWRKGPSAAQRHARKLWLGTADIGEGAGG
jgi:predicted metalloprotease with PDZ domain